MGTPYWSLVQKTDGCWLWTGLKNRNGYGVHNFGGRRRMAHRHSFEIAHGTIPRGAHVLHRCDTPACVNPDHLWLGDTQSNMTDCAAKDRIAFGERHHAAKLTEGDVRSIRRLRATGHTQKQIAAQFGITRGHVSDITLRKIWVRVI